MGFNARQPVDAQKLISNSTMTRSIMASVSIRWCLAKHMRATDRLSLWTTDHHMAFTLTTWNAKASEHALDAQLRFANDNRVQLAQNRLCADQRTLVNDHRCKWYMAMNLFIFVRARVFVSFSILYSL